MNDDYKRILINALLRRADDLYKIGNDVGCLAALDVLDALQKERTLTAELIEHIEKGDIGFLPTG